jgi:Mn-dependent DtxR family transcriptional regulator
MKKQKFHTFREDMKSFEKNLTASMEDYLEMIYRLSENDGYTRIYELSSALNVQPPSATNMVQKLSKLNLLKYEKYGIIKLENNGLELGKTLLNRHITIETFFGILGVDRNNVLKETERIEHTISNDTLRCISRFINFINDNQNILIEFNKYKKERG